MRSEPILYSNMITKWNHVVLITSGIPFKLDSREERKTLLPLIPYTGQLRERINMFYCDKEFKMLTTIVIRNSTVQIIVP